MASALTAPTSLGTANNSSGNATITMTAAVAPGDGVALFIANSAIAATISSIADTRGNSYTASANSPATGSTRRSWIYICQATGSIGLRVGDTISITFASGGAFAARAVNLHAVKSTSPADKAPAAASATSTAPNSGSTGTLVQADELELGLIATDGLAADTFTIGGGFTSLGNVFNTVTANVGLYPAYKIVAVTTGDTYSATITSRAWVASVATYRAGTFPDALRLAGIEVEADLSGGKRALAGLLAEYDWLDATALTVQPGTIATAEVVYAPLVALTIAAIQPGTIPSAAQVYAPTVQASPRSSGVPLKPSRDILRAPVLVAGVAPAAPMLTPSASAAAPQLVLVR